MNEFHSLLSRQLKKYFGRAEDIPQELIDFIKAVNNAYFESDTDREMLERSLDLSSQEMLRTHAEMRAIFHAIPDMLFVIDEEGTILDQKAGTTADVYPAQKKPPIGKRIQDIPVPEVAQKFREALGMVKQSKRPISIEYTLTIRGTVNHYEARLAPVIEDQFIAIVRNITDQKLAEENLRRERDFTNTLVQSSPAFFVAVNPADRIIMVNNAMLKATGYTAEEVTGKEYLTTFVPVAERPVILEVMNAYHSAPKPVAIESPVLTKQGQELLVEWHGRPVLNQDGEMEYFFGVGLDITGKKQLEAQLQQAQKMEAIGTLAGGIAHDFNNLLMGIGGQASMMLMDMDPSHQHYEYLVGIQEHVKSASGLTRQLLGFARGGKYEAKPTDLNDLIRRNADMFGRTRKELHIEIQYEDDLHTVEVDQGQIDQVLLNLYVNAFQAMPAGGDLLIRTENTTLDEAFVKPYGAEPGEYAVVSVTDTGLGMDKDTQERIFDPFFTTKGMGRGTGLGLASVYGIIKHHNGIIKVTSEKGKGTTFTIYLPASDKKVEKETVKQEKLMKGTEMVLLVDDEEMVLDINQQMIDALGYTVITAESGEEATEIYEKNRGQIDIVILDMIMPDMSGSKTFDVLRALNTDVKVLLSSGYSLDGQAEEILNRGCNGFIQKPFSIEDLSQKLRDILDQEDESAEAGKKPESVPECISS